MAMLFARAAIPAWVVVLGIGAFLAPPGIARTVLLIALCLVCIPAVITAGVWKRTLDEPTADVMDVGHSARRPPEVIDAEFVAGDVTKDDQHGARALAEGRSRLHPDA